MTESLNESSMQPEPSSPHADLQAAAIAAGVKPDLVAMLYNVARDAEEHEWMQCLRDWAADHSHLIDLAIIDPAQMNEACTLLLASDGLRDDPGQRAAGFSNKRCAELERFISKI